MKFVYKKISDIRIVIFFSFVGLILGYYFHFSSLIILFSIVIVWSLSVFSSKKVIFVLSLSIFVIFFYKTDFFIKKRKIDFISFKSQYEKEVVVKGMVSLLPEKGLSNQELILNDLLFLEKKIEGKILVKTNLYPEYKYGDILKLDCKIQEAFSNSDFSYQEYLSDQEIYGICYYPQIEKIGVGGSDFLKLVNEVRIFLERKINSFFPEPEASLLAGVTLGVKRYLPKEFEGNLRRTGTTHIVVVSGANINFVLLTIMSFASLIGRKRTLIVAFLSITLYVFLVGFDPPVLRAFLMFVPVFLAKIFGREQDIIDSILLSALAIMFFNPLLIRSISFQLSFASTLGLILLMPIFNKIIKLPTIMGEAFSVSLAAQLMTLPIVIYNFREFSIISLFANLLVTPVISILTYGGFIFSFFIIFSNVLAKLFSVTFFIFLNYFIGIVTILGNLSWSSISIGEVSEHFVYIYYFLLGSFMIWSRFLLLKDE